MDNNRKNHENYREMANLYGKKEYTLLKMQDYGFWPEDLPLPFEQQKTESTEAFRHRQQMEELNKEKTQKLKELWEDQQAVQKALRDLEKEYAETLNIEKIKRQINRSIMEESIRRRAERKKQREEVARRKSEDWQKKKAENILFIGIGYSGLLHEKQMDKSRLQRQNLPLISTDHELAEFLQIEYTMLRALTYHRDVMKDDHYYRYTIPKKSGGERQIAAPKKILKSVQRKILDEILAKIPVENPAHGFIKGKSVVTGAKVHQSDKDFVINLDIQDFFPSIDFFRVRGLFKGFGYSGYIASLFAMLCTYSERMEIKVKEETMQVKTSGRILPQGSPASPMITNILCRQMDKRLQGFAVKYALIYTRYADDMSFSGMDGYCFDSKNQEHLRKFLGCISYILRDEGFSVKKSKTRILTKNNRQEITGVVINDKEIGVPKPWVKNLRAAIHQCHLLKAQSKEIPKEKKNQINGMIQWLSCVNPKRYEKLIQAWRELSIK